LFKNYKISEGESDGYITLTDIVEHLNEDRKNENYAGLVELQKSELGRLMKDLFKDVQVKRRLMSSGSEKVTYISLTRRMDFECDEETLIPGVTYFGWTFRKYEVESLLFLKLSGIEIDNSEYVLQLTIKKDLSLFTLSGYKGSTLNSSELEFKKGDLPSLQLIIQFLNTLHICIGFEENEHTKAVIRHENNEIGSHHTFGFADGQTVTKVISKSCRLLVEKQGSYCMSCYTLERNLKRRKINDDICTGVCRKYLSRGDIEKELDDKMSDNKKSKQREKYWKGRYKFDDECLDVDEEDDGDLKTMLQGVDSSKVSDEMKLLFEEQIKFSKMSSSKGYRWHPK
jgi:hypothetical protein